MRINEADEIPPIGDLPSRQKERPEAIKPSSSIILIAMTTSALVVVTLAWWKDKANLDSIKSSVLVGDIVFGIWVLKRGIQALLRQKDRDRLEEHGI